MIRKARKEDFEQFFKLKSQFYELEKELMRKGDKLAKFFNAKPNKDEDKKLFKKWIKKKSSILLVAEEKGELIGYLFGEIKNVGMLKVKSGHIYDIMISKKSRNKGIGRKLEKEFLTWAKKKKVKFADLDVDWLNDKARRAYENWGYDYQNVRMLKKVKR
jgi:ribosomal protein S18 acetylase RimI-like enzyme